MSNVTAGFRSLGRADQLPDNSANPYYLADRKLRLAVARVDGRLYAVDGLCTHGRCPLTAGLLAGTILICPCDASRFDLTTGAVVNGPAAGPLATYEVREADGEIQVRLPG